MKTALSVLNRRMHLILTTVVVAQVIIAVLGFVQWRQQGVDRTPLVRLETGLAPGTPLSIESAMSAATQRAREWADEAFLFAAGTQVDWPVDGGAGAGSDLPGNGWVLFTFASEQGEGDGGVTLSMLIDRLSGVIIDEREMAWGRAPARRLDLTTYPISSTVSLFAADVSVGQAYRNACLPFRHVSRASFVLRENGNGAFWLVTYEDSRSAGRPDLRVEIDAISGEVTRDDSHVPGNAC